MTSLVLQKPTLAHGEEIMAFRQEMLEEGGDFAGCNSLRRCETPMMWLALLEVYEKSGPKGGVPSSTYLALEPKDHRLVGIIDLRHHINHPVLSTWGGHVGYTVRPSERRKGYATQMLRLLLPHCKELGLRHILVTCNKDNIASEKVILRAGGVFEKEIAGEGFFSKRFWITI